MFISRILIDLRAIRIKHRNKKRFCRYCLQCFSSEKVLVEHIKICLKVNGKQSIKLRNGLIKFNNRYKHLAVSFKIYADSESVFKRVQKTNRDGNAFYTKKYQEHIPCSFTYKIVCIDHRFSKLVVLYRGKNAFYKFVAKIRNECQCCRGVIKNTCHDSG